MIYLSLENILLILIVLYVFYSLYDCNRSNIKINIIEKFNDQINILKDNLDNIEKLNELKNDEKLNILFTLYINILKMLSSILRSGIIDESITILFENIDKIFKNKKLNKSFDLDKIKDLTNNDSIREILGYDLYNKNIKFYHDFKSIFNKNNNVIDLKENN